MTRSSGNIGVIAASSFMLAALALDGGAVQAADWDVGDVFVGVSNGTYQIYDNNGVFKETIIDGLGGFTTGCAFCPTLDKLYTTNFSSSIVVVYDDAHPHGISTIIDTGLQGGGLAESVVFAANGDFYVGHAGGDLDIQKYSAANAFITKFNVATQFIGSDWIELAADQETLFYTSESSSVLRFDTLPPSQLADFSGVGLQMFALRLLPPGDGTGGLLVANRANILRLDGTGAIAQTYDAPLEDDWFALNLDPNGTSFWSGDFGTSNFYRFNIATGAVEVGPINTGTGASTLFGICVKGEITAATPGACCLPGGACVQLVEPDCVAAGGTFLGAVPCLPDPCDEGERAHPGWNWVDNAITLTANEPTYWSALTGQPKGVSPFTVLDPGDPPGRPAMDGTTDRVLRGYVVGWAVDQNGNEIRWNHLKGEGTIINYGDDAAWEYNTWNHAVVSGVANGEPLAEPGVLRMDGNEYSLSFDELLLNFQAAGSDGFSNGPAGFLLQSDTDLTLHPPAADLRQNSDGPVTTKASMDIWNENETKFSGTHRCITCWDQTLISRYDVPNSFLYPFLQTDHGKARIDGHAADVCDVLDDPDTPEDESVTSVLSPLLGVYARMLWVNDFIMGAGKSASGSNLVGLGTDDTAVIQYDVSGDDGPPEGQWPGVPQDLADRLFGVTKRKAAPSTGDGLVVNGATALVGPGQDRVSATEKGSLVFFTKVEIRWNAANALMQDTFLSLTNDYPKDVRVQLYFINGDAPLDAVP